MSFTSIRQVAVLGLGTMGHGIAQCFAQAGYQVRGFDEQAAARATAHDRIRRNLGDFVAADLIPARAVEETLARIQVVDSAKEAVADAHFVTEAVPEEIGLKQELFARLEGAVADSTILASNSSTFPISHSGVRLRRPERALVTHWFNPPHLVPTVEVVPGPRTNEETTRTTVALLRQLGKLAVRLNQELPGFLVNRVQVALIREVLDLLEKGVASAEDIDAAIRGSIGFRLAAQGPLEICDFGGLDIWSRVFANLVPHICSDAQLPAAGRRLVEAGHLGYKTGRGFHQYPPETADQKRSQRDLNFLALLKMLYHNQEKGNM